jgi:lysophospholipase L1-like esterase
MGHRIRADALILAIVVLAGCTSDPSPTSIPTTPQSPAPSPSVAAVASGEPSAAAEAGGAYLALGDSITFGIGVPRPQQNGYVARVADALAAATAEPRISSTRVFAVPGETASGFLDRRLDDVERAIQGLGAGVELVTIGLGANEILRARREPACVADRASEDCRAVVESATEVAASSLDAVVEGVQSALEAAGSDAAVLLLAYYNPDLDPLAVESVAGSDDAVGCDPLEERPGLNDRIACVATERSVQLVDLYDAFLGREDDLTRFGSGDVHPNAEGYAVIAETLVDVIGTIGPNSADDPPGA